MDDSSDSEVFSQWFLLHWAGRWEVPLAFGDFHVPLSWWQLLFVKLMCGFIKNLSIWFSYHHAWDDNAAHCSQCSTWVKGRKFSTTFSAVLTGELELALQPFVSNNSRVQFLMCLMKTLYKGRLTVPHDPKVLIA